MGRLHGLIRESKDGQKSIDSLNGLIKRAEAHLEEASKLQDIEVQPDVASDTTAEPVPTGMQTRETRCRARAASVANVISELTKLKPRLFDDEREYERLEAQHPEFTCFQVAKGHPDLKLKIRSIQGSRQHVRLAQEIVAAQYGLALATIKDDWKHYKPEGYQNRRHSEHQV